MLPGILRAISILASCLSPTWGGEQCFPMRIGIQLGQLRVGSAFARQLRIRWRVLKAGSGCARPRRRRDEVQLGNEGGGRRSYPRLQYQPNPQVGANSHRSCDPIWIDLPALRTSYTRHEARLALCHIMLVRPGSSSRR